MKFNGKWCYFCHSTHSACEKQLPINMLVLCEGGSNKTSVTPARNTQAATEGRHVMQRHVDNLCITKNLGNCLLHGGATGWMRVDEQKLFTYTYIIQYSQVPNKRPLGLLLFQFCPTPWTLLGPPFITFEELYFFMNLWFHSISLLVQFTPNIQGKIKCFCIHFSPMLYDHLFLLFPSLYNHLRPFLKFRLPPFIWTPR